MSHYADHYDKDDFPKPDSIGGIIYFILLFFVIGLFASIYFILRYHEIIPNLFKK